MPEIQLPLLGQWGIVYQYRGANLCSGGKPLAEKVAQNMGIVQSGSCLLYLVYVTVTVLPRSSHCQSLYSDRDDVMELRASDFNSQLLGKDHAWVVEFYAAWCGHCQRFAPVWKEFATNVLGKYNV